MATFTLGLSMAGTVSVGSYTAGSLTEIHSWLDKFYAKRNSGTQVKLVATGNAGPYKIGDVVVLEPSEIPTHDVQIASLTGASGGGINAALLLVGLALNEVESILRDTWLNVDVREMLDVSDITNKRDLYALLNVKPIDAMVEVLKNKVFGDQNFTTDKGFLADVVELYQTLSSYEGIPFNLSPSIGTGPKLQYGTYFTHMDYTRFGFAPKASGLDQQGFDEKPFRLGLNWQKGMRLSQDPNWLKLLQASPATAAFPVGFQPRSLKRYRKEYDGKLFYLDYNNRQAGSATWNYKDISPSWNAGNPDDSFDMEYFDGGAFNTDTHDLARASLLRKLQLNSLPRTGKEVKAAVILIDPFPNEPLDYNPGEKVKGLPDLLNQIPLLLGSLMNQGRFRADWIEKITDEEYYSRYLISAVRKNPDGNLAKFPLAGASLGAFGGFLDRSFREHDYQLGNYNTYQFLAEHLLVPIDNKTVTYCQTSDQALLDKYEALGWYKPNDSRGRHCQIIPRFVFQGLLNSKQPEWPTMARSDWSQIVGLAENRGKVLADHITSFSVMDKPADWAIWKFFGKGKFEKLIQSIEDELVNRGQLR